MVVMVMVMMLMMIMMVVMVVMVVRGGVAAVRVGRGAGAERCSHHVQRSELYD